MNTTTITSAVPRFVVAAACVTAVAVGATGCGAAQTAATHTAAGPTQAAGGPPSHRGSSRAPSTESFIEHQKQEQAAHGRRTATQRTRTSRHDHRPAIRRQVTRRGAGADSVEYAHIPSGR